MSHTNELQRLRHVHPQQGRRVVPKLSSRWAWGWAIALSTLVLLNALASQPLHAEELTAERDPTAAPAAARAPAAPASASTDAGPASSGDLISAALAQRLVINDKPFLVDRGWLRGVGDYVGEARIEKIEPTAVWLREAGVLRKLPLYPQVQVLPASPVKTASINGLKAGRKSATGAQSAPAADPMQTPPGTALEETR